MYEFMAIIDGELVSTHGPLTLEFCLQMVDATWALIAEKADQHEIVMECVEVTVDA